MNKLVLAAVIIGSLVWWFWGRTLEPARVIQAQLEAISHNDYPTAYGFLSSAAKEKMTIAQFRETVEKNRVVAENYTSEFLDRKIENNVATFKGTIRTLGALTTPATFIVVKEGDRWVIQEFLF